MKALSLTQPWASLVAIGAKKIETRSWARPHKGALVIHAAKGWPQQAQLLCDEYPFFNALTAAGISTMSHHNLPLGAIVAVCAFVEIWTTDNIFRRFPSLHTDQERAFGDYSAGRYAWLLHHVQRLPEPIPCRGALGLWAVPPEIEAQILAQLRRLES